MLEMSSKPLWMQQTPVTLGHEGFCIEEEEEGAEIFSLVCIVNVYGRGYKLDFRGVAPLEKPQQMEPQDFWGG